MVKIILKEQNTQLYHDSTFIVWCFLLESTALYQSKIGNNKLNVQQRNKNYQSIGRKGLI